MIALAGCTDPSAATRAVEAQGLTDVETTGWRMFGCGRGDRYHTGFRATNIRGQQVTGVACGGLLKATTVRFD